MFKGWFTLLAGNTFIPAQRGMVGKSVVAVAEEQLREVAELANVVDGIDDFLPEDFRQECQ